MNKPDWKNVQQVLMSEARKAIADFVEEYPDETVCNFGFDADPENGQILISIDTLDNAIYNAWQWQEEFLQRWREEARSTWSSDTVNRISESQIGAAPAEYGEFSVIGYRELEFPQWEEYIEALEDDDDDGEDTAAEYVVAEASRAMFLALDTLVQEDAFDKLRLAERCVIGFVTHDSEPITTHVLNWPEQSHAGASLAVETHEEPKVQAVAGDSGRTLNVLLHTMTEEALAQIVPMAAAGWGPAQSIEEQLRWCLALASDTQRETPPGPFSMGLIATREFDMYGDQPDLALLINKIQAEAEAQIKGAMAPRQAGR